MNRLGQIPQHHAETRVLSLDVWNTLLRRNPAFGEKRTAAIAHWLGVSLQDAREAVCVADIDANNRQVQGQDIDDVWRLRQAASVVGRIDHLSDVEVARASIRDAFAAHPPSLLEGDATLLSILEARRRGLDVRIVSNTGWVPAAVVRRELERLGVIQLVTLAAFSDEVRAAKPDPRIFQHAAGTVRPQDILHVGDDPVTDYWGATRCGMQALLLRPSGEPVQGCRTVQSLQDVLRAQ